MTLPGNPVELHDKMDEVYKLYENARKSGNLFEALTLANLFTLGAVVSMILAVRRDYFMLARKTKKIAEYEHKQLKDLKEREGYRILYLMGFISKETYNALNAFFNKRNDATHRYIFEGTKYESITQVLILHDKAIELFIEDQRSFMENLEKNHTAIAKK